jgi:dihydrofolate reductase
MRHLVSVVHLSLDGFVAGANGELDGFPTGDENLAFVCDLTKDCDAALFGRVSYELLNGFWPTAGDNPAATAAEKAYSKWYNEVQKIVVSKTLPEVKEHHTMIIRENTATELHKIKRQPGKHILIFGSPTLSHELMSHDLIDSYWIFINPVLFGEGIPFFRGSTTRSKLRLVNTKRFANGEVALHYGVEREM